MKFILATLALLLNLSAADIYVNGEKVGGVSDQNVTSGEKSKNEILKEEGRKQLCAKGYRQYC